jgi:tRNA(fMet)-specific endonuclease VapC
VTYLVDTDRVTDWLVGRTDAIELLARLSTLGMSISLITYGEIFEGIYFGRNSTAGEVAFRQFLREVDVLPLNRAIMQRFTRVRGELRRRGQLIGDPDILIAATALHHNLTLVTRNLKDFQRISGLDLYSQT